MFVNMKVGDDTGKEGQEAGYQRARQDDEEFELEPPRFSLDGGSDDDNDDMSIEDEGRNKPQSSMYLQSNAPMERVRSRSPHSVRKAQAGET